MTLDLSTILKEWPYEPGQINVRVIRGDDGEHRIQMRIDLGVLQMETIGRPDGTRPNGFESLLDYYEQLIESLGDPGAGEELESGSGAASGEGAAPIEDYYLSSEDARMLREEALQYYHRYIALLVLGDFEGVIRDTTRNLRVIELLQDYAEEEDDRLMLLQFCPYVLMMRARALASMAVEEKETKAAMLAIDQGLEQIKGFFESQGQGEMAEQSQEVALLRGMRAELSNKLPAGQKTELRERLRAALAQENYELAAILRDELRMLKD